jgi:hypothetical protein
MLIGMSLSGTDTFFVRFTVRVLLSVTRSLNLSQDSPQTAVVSPHEPLFSPRSPIVSPITTLVSPQLVKTHASTTHSRLKIPVKKH